MDYDERVIYSTLGALIKEHRNQKGLTQAELAKKVGLPRTGIANIEAGRQRLYLHTLINIANALDINICSVIDQIKPGPQQRTGSIPVLHANREADEGDFESIRAALDQVKKGGKHERQAAVGKGKAESKGASQ